ncbi:MAG: HEAT repeat domain-containing protein, partial [Nitrospiraceae bacterium]
IHLELLVASLHDDNPGVQQAAVSGLVTVGGNEVARHMVALLRESPMIRNMAVEVLDRIVAQALECILPVLSAEDSNVRKFIVDALGKQTDVRVIAPLMQRLTDVDANVRAAAAEALGHVRACEAVPGIIALLNDEEWVVFSALTALAEIGDSAALPSLLILLNQGTEAVRCAAVEAIAELDREGTTIPTLVDLAATAQPELRRALIKTLVSMTDGPRSGLWTVLDHATWLNFLTDALGDENPDCYLPAIIGLGRLGDRRGTFPLVNRYRELDQPSEDVTEQVVTALVKTGDIPALMTALRTEKDHVKLVVLRSLGELRAAEAIPALSVVLSTSPSWELRKEALTALGQIGGDHALAQIRDAVDDATGYVRREAVRLVGETGRLEAMSLVDRLATERYQDVRDEIVQTLARIGTSKVLVSLVGLTSHGRAEVREAAIRAIGLIKSADGLQSLMDAVNDPEWRVREAAIEAIGNVDDSRMLPTLLLALADGHEKVRLAAIAAVARWNQPDARHALVRQSLQDADVWVRYRAVERLGHYRIVEAVRALETIVMNGHEPAVLLHGAAMALAQIGGRHARAVLARLLRHENDEVRAVAIHALEEQESALDVADQEPHPYEAQGRC